MRRVRFSAFFLIIVATVSFGIIFNAANFKTSSNAVFQHKPIQLISLGKSKRVGEKHDPNGNMTAATSIPRILHYVFKDGMPFESYKQMIRTCLELNPDWAVYLWRDSDSMRLIRDSYKRFEKKYIGYKDRLEKSDSVRYLILHRFGGIYLDMDVECLKPFDQLLQMGPIKSSSSGSQFQGISAFLGEERREQTRILYGYSSCTMNSLMGSTPGHPFFHFVINRMQSMPNRNHARLSTGPDFLTRSHISWLSCADCQQNQHPVVIFPARVVSPIMDTSLVNWETKCLPYFKTQRLSSKNLASSAVSNEEFWRRLGCAELVAKGWRFDDTDNATVAVHRFTHMGYGNQARKKTFDLMKEFSRVKAYYRM